MSPDRPPWERHEPRDPRDEYSRLVAEGAWIDERAWQMIPGPERAAIRQRLHRGDAGPRWLDCNCGSGAIQLRWGHSPYCEHCGSLL